MADLNLTRRDRNAVRKILRAERAAGVPVPLLPLDVDIDGDGICDAFGLDENDQVVIVSGITLEHTVYVSEGDDIGGAG